MTLRLFLSFLQNAGLLNIALGLSIIPTAWAGPFCDNYKDSNDSFYKLLCTNGAASTKPAGANSTFSSAFNLSTASLPTEPSSYGLEALMSVLSTDSQTGHLGWSPTFSLIKGFHKFGTGISTGSNNTFYGNDILQRIYATPNVTTFTPIESPRGFPFNLNVGTSFLVMDPQSGPKFQLGLSVRYNKTSDTWGGGPGFLVLWDHFSVGAGFTEEKVSNMIDRTTFTSIILSAHFSIFEFEYTQLNTLGNTVQLDGLSPIQILSVTATLRRLTLSAAVRSLNYLNYGYATQPYYSVQFMFTKNFTGGLIVNFIPGTGTLGTQFYL